MRRAITVLAVTAAAVLVSGSGCTSRDESALAQIQPGQTVFADLWKEDNGEGDRALVEQKPSGLWVIDTSVHFRTTRQGVFDVKITLDPATGQFIVGDMGGTKVGYDHDDCLSVADGDREHYAAMQAPKHEFEPGSVKPNPSGPGVSDDCVVTPEAA